MKEIHIFKEQKMTSRTAGGGHWLVLEHSLTRRYIYLVDLNQEEREALADWAKENLDFDPCESCNQSIVIDFRVKRMRERQVSFPLPSPEDWILREEVYPPKEIVSLTS